MRAISPPFCEEDILFLALNVLTLLKYESTCRQITEMIHVASLIHDDVLDEGVYLFL